MKFDITIGNPPFKDTYSGGKETDIYNEFINKMLDLDSDFVSFIIPSKWFTSSNKSLTDLRKRMISGSHLRFYTDYEDSFFILDTEERVQGGCGFFLYDKQYSGECTFAHFNENGWDINSKDLTKHDIVARDELFQSILDKISNYANTRLEDTDNTQTEIQYLEDLVDKRGFIIEDGTDALSSETLAFNTKVYTKDSIVYVERNSIKHGQNLLPYYSVLVGIDGKSTDIRKDRYINIVTRIKKPMEAASKYYMVMGKFNTCLEALSLESFLNTDIIKFLVYKLTLNSSFNKQTLRSISIVPFNRLWGNSELATEFGITNNELKYVSMVLSEQLLAEEYEECN